MKTILLDDPINTDEMPICEGRKLLFFFSILMGNGSAEPKYDGYQLWSHENIPDYTDISKNVINQKYSIKNYVV